MPFARFAFPALAVAALVATAGPARAQSPSASSSNIYEAASGRYGADLAAQCPAKHLEWIAPGEMPDHIDDFETTLNPTTNASLDPTGAALPGGGLAHCPGTGASCGVATRIAVYDKLGLLPQFVKFMCALPERCTDQSTCAADPAHGS